MSTSRRSTGSSTSWNGWAWWTTSTWATAPPSTTWPGTPTTTWCATAAARWSRCQPSCSTGCAVAWPTTSGSTSSRATSPSPAGAGTAAPPRSLDLDGSLHGRVDLAVELVRPRRRGVELVGHRGHAGHQVALEDGLVRVGSEDGDVVLDRLVVVV